MVSMDKSSGFMSATAMKIVDLESLKPEAVQFEHKNVPFRPISFLIYQSWTKLTGKKTVVHTTFQVHNKPFMHTQSGMPQTNSPTNSSPLNAAFMWASFNPSLSIPSVRYFFRAASCLSCTCKSA